MKSEPHFDMDALLEICTVLTRSKLRALDVFPGAEPSKLQIFYERISAGDITTDDDAAAVLFGAERSDSRYQKLKAELKSRLLNALFMVDLKQPSYTDRQRAFYTCYQDYAAARILQGKNAHKASAQLLTKALRTAIKYEFTDLVVEASATLRIYYATREGNLSQFEHYNNLYSSQMEVLRAERLAEGLYGEIVARQVNSKAKLDQVGSLAREYFGRLEPHLKESDSYGLHLPAMLLNLFVYTGSNAYREAVAVCRRYIDFFENKPYAANVPLQIAYYQLLVCYTQLGEYDAGREAAKRCHQLQDEGTFNWFKYREQYFLLSMHSGNYTSALKIFLKTFAHPRLKSMPPSIQEYWRIFEAYLYYLIESGVLIESEETFRFRLGRFLNETPLYSKDKRGLNIPILIIQILLLLQKGETGEILNRIEAIKKYSSRYLRRDDTFRSNCFIQMLLQLPDAGYHPQRIIPRTEALFKKLQSMPLSASPQTSEIEIIPYETLWNLALDSASQNSLQIRNFKRAMKKTPDSSVD